MSDTNGKMTAREREELMKLTRRREAVAKTEAKQRAAELKVDLERKLAAEYKHDDERWAKITEAAKEAVAATDAQIAALCRELGIPESFRPGLHLQWYDRGENASKKRREELRRVGDAWIDAKEKAAKTVIEKQSVEIQGQIVAGGLDTEAARTFLESMPTVETLMGPVALEKLEAAVPLKALGGG